MSVPVQKFMTQTPHTIGHDMSVDKAQGMMAKYSCHHLPVLDGGKLVGIISDRDLRMAAKLVNHEEVLVETIMTEEPIVVKPTEDIFQVAMLMHQNKIGSVIVSASEDAPWGIFTATDALAYFSEK